MLKMKLVRREPERDGKILLDHGKILLDHRRDGNIAVDWIGNLLLVR